MALRNGAYGSLRPGALGRVAATIAATLHEPPQRAFEIAVRASLNAARWSREANRCIARLARGAEPPAASSDAEARQLRAFAEYLADEPAPKLVLSMHAGNFLVNVLKALAAAPIGTTAHVPVPSRSIAALSGIPRYAEARGKRVVLLPLKSGAAVALRGLRRREDVAFVLVDLGADHGRTFELPFLGAPAHLVDGPYVLARRLRASITWLENAPSLAFAGPFDGCLLADPPPVEAIGARFVAEMDARIRRDPAAWSRWQALPLLRQPEGERAC
jgi:lauroyl/myristoyl acyltransferase